MHLPVVAIVGRPNVGKSTFFNRVLHRRQAVVDDTPGVTRDRHAGLAEWIGRSFFLVDTGGWMPGATEGMEARIADQVLQALNECDAVVFMVDGREGLQLLDEEISLALHRLSSTLPVMVLANKVDGERWDAHAHEFAALGWETVLPVSSTEGRLVGEALDALMEKLPSGGSMQEPEEGTRIAILGRPNVGKSSLTNRLIGQERVIVDAVPGTTRDAIDVPWRWHGRTLWLIDTAGIRHRWDHLPGFEFYASLRSIRALERADAALLLIDATEKVSRQDQRVAALIEDSGKPVLILVNKWDAVEKDNATMKRYEEDVREALSFLDYAPMMFISALTGQRSSLIAEKILALHEASLRQIPTHEVNEVLREAIERTPARGTHGKRAPKLLYSTQIGTSPPTFALFTRNPEGLGAEYTRYLGRRFREAFGFEGSPIRFKIRRTTGSTPARGKKRS
jgi:GTPase